MRQRYVINRALLTPVLVAGVEKRLLLANVLCAFPLVAATHFTLPAALIGVLFFIVMHLVLVRVSRHDPYAGLLFKRSTRYVWQGYFPAISHPVVVHTRPVPCLLKVW